MEISISSPVLVFRSSKNLVKTPIRVNPNPNLIRRNDNNLLIGTRKVSTRISAIDEVAYVANPVQVEVTWQIVVGALAGVSPFVVAGIEFSKRIIAQRRCEICGGSGLVLRDKTYFRCPGCGGFLPWQSWKRFFSG